jgi:hypothetical protein
MITSIFVLRASEYKAEQLPRIVYAEMLQDLSAWHFCCASVPRWSTGQRVLYRLLGLVPHANLGHRSQLHFIS